MFENFYSDALRQIEVSVSGEWRAGTIRDWKGHAIAPEPIVAVSFVARDARVYWCKSERADPAGQPVGLLLGHYDAAMLDVQVSFSIGGGGSRTRTVVGSPIYRPMIQPTMTVTTANIMPFSTVEGSQRVRLFALFLAGSDVKVGRNGLWRLRPKLVESIPAHFRNLLTYGRTGEWDSPTDAVDRSELIDAWIEYRRLSSSSNRAARLRVETSHGWASGKMFDLTHEQPELAWELILEILARDPDDAIKGLVAAGPLQDLVDLHSQVFADRIEEQARRSTRFREMLSGLITIPDELFQQIQHLLPERFQ